MSYLKLDKRMYTGGETKSSPVILIGAGVGLLILVVVIILVIRKKKTAPAPAPAPVTKSAGTPAAPANVNKQISGCEADTALLRCDSGLIKGGNLRYGRWDNSVCPHPTVNASTLPKEKTYPVPNICLGKKECSLAGYNAFLNEDVYPNVYKQWEAKYQCQ